MSTMLLLCGGTVAKAQTSHTGVVTGRILNAETNEYVRNAEVSVEGTSHVAYSGADGSYILTGVPSGEARIVVRYTGYESPAQIVKIASDSTVRHDFELRGSAFRGRKGEEVIELQKFVISAERAGNAKAIMEQRAALNVKNAVASDNFGDITGGNIGEFIKYLPGVVVDYSDDDARGVRIGGLDGTYTAVTFDGARMATAASATFGANSRQFEFEQAAIASIEFIEVNKTLNASMPADAPAGVINLRSKSALDRKGRHITFTGTMSANEYEMNLKRTPSPGDGRHRKVLPGFVLNYSDLFGDRLGVNLTLSANSVFTEQAGITNTHDTSNAARGPIPINLSLRDNPKITTRASAGINLDYRVAPDLIFSLRTQFSHLELDINSRLTQFVTTNAQLDPASTATNVIARPAAGSATRIQTMLIGNVNKFNNTTTYLPKLEYKRNDLTITAEGTYSRSRTHYDDRRSGYWGNLNNHLTRTGWQAQRSSTESADWVFTQLAGRPWDQMASFNRDDTITNNVVSNERNGGQEVWEGKLSGKKDFKLSLPITINAGLETRSQTFELDRTGPMQWTYVGPANSVLHPSTVMIAHPELGLFDNRHGGNISSLNIPIPDATKMYSLFLEHPEYFSENVITNFNTMNTSARSAEERIDSGFIMFDTRWRNLRLNLGVRHERTSTTALNFDRLPASEVLAAGFTPGTIPYITYEYQNFQRFKNSGGFDNTFLSGGAKYSLTKNLVLQVAASQSIRRPSINNIAGVVTVNETNQTVTVPNPGLKPQESDKYFAGIQYYLEPAGTLSISGYQLDVLNLSVANRQITAEEAGYGDNTEYEGYTFLRPENIGGTRKIKGFEIEYNQQLTFLPGFARGFSVFGSVSRTLPDIQVAQLVPTAASGGIRYGNHRFNLQLRGTWTSDVYVSGTAANALWRYDRLMLDLSGSFKLNEKYDLTLSGRNIGNSAYRQYLVETKYLQQSIRFGALWTVGIRGKF